MDTSQKCINSFLPSKWNMEIVHSCHQCLMNEFLEVFKTPDACESIVLKLFDLHQCCAVSLLD